MIRDKENELADVRKTMEQNEEIIVKVNFFYLTLNYAID